MRYFMRLSYRGASYYGWQVQPHDPSVQQAVEQALATLLRRPTAVTGAGRTDTAVNAAMMVAHFDVEQPIGNVPLLVRSLNGILPRDIAIQAVAPMHDTAHARFDATSRTYKYFTHTAKSPFLYPLSWPCHVPLDYPLMNQAAGHLLEVDDFTSFSKLHTDVKTNRCRVTHAAWEREGEQWVFTITADRFLRNMVRAVVGTLVDVGTHKLSLQRFDEIIALRNRSQAGTSMPGHALFLWNITYPYPIP
ncbi:MAG: tRNA pseudouridine(38-40) synthase TruA [Muribaculaceae bacterium]|nr:tRNA pseudouridine(38-40) synthase TruA [Muribaculaceae bacterium]